MAGNNFCMYEPQILAPLGTMSRPPPERFAPLPKTPRVPETGHHASRPSRDAYNNVSSLDAGDLNP